MEEEKEVWAWARCGWVPSRVEASARRESRTDRRPIISGLPAVEAKENEAEQASSSPSSLVEGGVDKAE